LLSGAAAKVAVTAVKPTADGNEKVRKQNQFLQTPFCRSSSVVTCRQVLLVLPQTVFVVCLQSADGAEAGSIYNAATRRRGANHKTD